MNAGGRPGPRGKALSFITIIHSSLHRFVCLLKFNFIYQTLVTPGFHEERSSSAALHSVHALLSAWIGSYWWYVTNQRVLGAGHWGS